MADWDFIIAPRTITVRVMLNEAATLINSLKLLSAAQAYSGLAEWVVQTSERMSPERKQLNTVIMEVADHIKCTYDSIARNEDLTYRQFVDELSAAEIQELRENLLRWLHERDGYPGDDVILANRQTFLDYTRGMMAAKIEKGYEFDEGEWSLRYSYILNPSQLRKDMVEHMEYMWSHYLKTEWRRARPILEEMVSVFSQIDYAGISALEVVETITGRNMRGREEFEEMVNRAERLTFIPSPHIGPYIGYGTVDDDKEVIFIFGARQTKHAAAQSSALSRSELLVRLNALADETRLKMLELLTRQEEICAQDFITTLDLSQSSASRHLRQLTAAGFISERRRDVAKCYSLSTDRVDDTIRALKEFLCRE